MSLVRGGLGDIELARERVLVSSPQQLSGALDSTKEYFLDGVIDFTGSGLSIEVPEGGLYLRGYNFDISGIKCDDDNYTLFTSPVGGSGNVLGADYLIDVNGANSRVYNLSSLTGFEAFEFTRINYNNCTSLGTIDSYRQGLEDGTGRFGGSPSLELAGLWAGGYRITTSIVRSLSPSMTEPLFKAGAGFVMQSRFLTDINIDLPANSALSDFSSSNFPNPSTLQINGAIVTRDGVQDATDANYTPNINAGDLSCSWSSNVGMPNTFEGGAIGIATELATDIVSAGAFVDVAAASWSVTDLQHFDNPAGGQLRHVGVNPREYKVISSMSASSTANNVLTLRVVKWDNSVSSFITVLDQVRQVNNFTGSRDVAFFNVNINVTLDQFDYVKLQVANQTSTSDVTFEADGYYLVEQR